jgi:hypothetical protein
MYTRRRAAFVAEADRLADMPPGSAPSQLHLRCSKVATHTHKNTHNARSHSAHAHTRTHTHTHTHTHACLTHIV